MIETVRAVGARNRYKIVLLLIGVGLLIGTGWVSRSTELILGIIAVGLGSIQLLIYEIMGFNREGGVSR